MARPRRSPWGSGCSSCFLPSAALRQCQLRGYVLEWHLPDMYTGMPSKGPEEANDLHALDLSCHNLRGAAR
eukprot:8187620-Lingulodinium_polyedra.AAC.1